MDVPERAKRRQRLLNRAGQISGELIPTIEGQLQTQERMHDQALEEIAYILLVARKSSGRG